MAEERDPKKSGDWLIQPPTYSEFKLSIGVGEGRKLSRETRDALERLSRTLFGGDSDTAKPCNVNCLDFDNCGTYECSPLGGCTVFTKGPCLALVTCQIADSD